MGMDSVADRQPTLDDLTERLAACTDRSELGLLAVAACARGDEGRPHRNSGGPTHTCNTIGAGIFEYLA